MITRNSAVAVKRRQAFLQYVTAWLTIFNTCPPHMCYDAEFGHSTSYHVMFGHSATKCVRRSEPQDWGVTGFASLRSRSG